MTLNAFFAYVLASVEDEMTKKRRKHEGRHRIKPTPDSSNLSAKKRRKQRAKQQEAS